MPSGKDSASKARASPMSTASSRGGNLRNKSVGSIQSHSKPRLSRLKMNSLPNPSLYTLSSSVTHFNRSGRSECDNNSRHHGHSKYSSRVVRDVAVTRLQRWIRAITIRRTIAQSGALALRISVLLEWQRRVRQVRICAAKRTLRNAFNAIAISLHGCCESMVEQTQMRCVSCVDAFLRARQSALLRAGKRCSRARVAVSCLEAAWLRCPLFARLQRLTMEERVHRLLFVQEDVERRDFVRLRFAFLVECHQRCYNDKALKAAGAPGVRRLKPWEHVVMDTDLPPCAISDESAVLDLPQLSPRKRQRLVSVREIENNSVSYVSAAEQLRWSIGAKEMIQSEAKASAAAAAVPSASGPRLSVDAAHAKELHNAPERLRLSRSDLAFLQLLQLDRGHIDFPTSMGARPPSFSEVPSGGGGSSSGVVLSADAWRLQDRWSAIDALETRLVWVADVLVRAEVRDMTLFGEILARLKARRQARQDQPTALIYGTHVDVVNARFLQPAKHWGGRDNGCSSSGERVRLPEDHTVSAASMGREWAELYRDVDLQKADKLVQELQSMCKTVSSSFSLKASTHCRNHGSFNMKQAGRISIDDLITASSNMRSVCGVSKSSMTSMRLADAGSTNGIQASTTAHLSSEFDIRYEIERLLICEYYHRVRIKEDYDVVSAAIRYVFRRLHGTIGAKVKNDDDRPVIRSKKVCAKA